MEMKRGGGSRHLFSKQNSAGYLIFLAGSKCWPLAEETEIQDWRMMNPPFVGNGLATDLAVNGLIRLGVLLININLIPRRPWAIAGLCFAIMNQYLLTK
jgi:hypothetical protein